MKLSQSGPVQLPDSPTAAVGYLNDLILQLQFAIDEIDKSFYSVSYAAPDRPRDLMIRFADGTTWNPGFGRGLYQYYDSSWHPIWAEQWG